MLAVDWGGALERAADLSLVAVLFVILFKWLLGTLTKDLQHIKKELTKLDDLKAAENRLVDRLTKDLRAKWEPHITGSGKSFVSVAKAKLLVEIGLNRDMYDVLARIATGTLWRANASTLEDVTEQLSADLWPILEETRTFLGMFETSVGLLRTPLDEQLPLTGPQGNAKGDKIFQRIIGEVAEILTSEEEESAKMRRVERLGKERLSQSRGLIFRWLGEPG